MKKNKLLAGMTILTIITSFFIPTNQNEAHAASAVQEKTVTFDLSTESSMSKTITIPQLYRVTSISVDNGSVNYSINGDKLTLNVSGGTVKRNEDDLDPIDVSDITQTSSSSYFSDSINYSKDGHSGTLSKDGNSYLIYSYYVQGACKSWTAGYDKASDPGRGHYINTGDGYSGYMSYQGENQYGYVVYTGTVCQPSYWVEQYGQKYKGTIYKDYYSYQVTFKYTLDETPPTLNLSVTNATTPSLTATIRVTSSDSESGIQYVQNPDGTIVSSTNFNFTATENGDYTFIVYDKSGNSVTKTITITNIDRVPPEFSFDYSTTGWTNKAITITANATDNAAGVSYITLPNGSTVSSTKATYTVSANGTYTFKVRDRLGNEYVQSVEITNFDNLIPTLNIEKKSEKANRIDVQLQYGD